jgi:hypothetical protein
MPVEADKSPSSDLLFFLHPSPPQKKDVEEGPPEAPQACAPTRLRPSDRGSWAHVRAVATWRTSDTETQAENWSEELARLEMFFERNPPPDIELTLARHTRIACPDKFVAAHLATCWANNGRATFLPYLERLRLLRVLPDIDPFPPVSGNVIF